jgi:hypothetical protein
LPVHDGVLHTTPTEFHSVRILFACSKPETSCNFQGFCVLAFLNVIVDNITFLFGHMFFSPLTDFLQRFKHIAEQSLYTAPLTTSVHETTAFVFLVITAILLILSEHTALK